MADSEDYVSQWLSGGGDGGWKKVTAKTYPPPIPSKFPWEMKRYCTEDGRLIIKVEKATCRLEYFEARRSEGRLRLDLVQYDNAIAEDFDGEDEAAEESMSGSASMNGGDQSGGEKIDEGEALADCHGGDGGGNRCSNSANVRVAVSKIRPVLRT